MFNRPNFPPSQFTISMDNLPALEELSEEEASAIAGGGAPKPGDEGINLVSTQPENQVPSICLRGIRVNQNTTVVSITELNTLGSSS